MNVFHVIENLHTTSASEPRLSSQIVREAKTHPGLVKKSDNISSTIQTI